MQKHMLESTHKQVIEFIILKSEKGFDIQLYYRFHTPALEIPHGRRLLLLYINNKMKSDSVIQYKDGSSQQWNWLHLPLLLLHLLLQTTINF